MLPESIDFSQINFLTFALVFLAGVLTSFTPCLYPLIPVTVSFIGARSLTSRSRGFALSIFYVLGLAVVYSGLGLLAALTGQIFGAWNSHPVTLIVLANIYLVLALGMLGVFDLSFRLASPSPGAPNVSSAKNYFTSFWVGAVSALAVGPCVAPVMGGLLTFIGKKGDLLEGAALMFVFSLGLGLLLVLIGTFAGLAARLPKSGAWMKWIKIIFAVILLGASQYFLIQAGKRLF